MEKHFYKNHEIEILATNNGNFIQASAKFNPLPRYMKTFSIWGKFPNLRSAEQAVLEAAKRLVDNRSN